MWEAIASNKRRSVFLVLAMAAVLVALGYLIGGVLVPGGQYPGVAVAVMLWLVLWLTASVAGSGILLGSVNAREIQHDDHPVLFNVVEEMTIAAGLPKMPKVYIMDTDAPNAFAVGTVDNSAVAVTSGLLMRLNRDELQGVVAHEIGHIKNYDTRFMMLAGVMMGAIILIADIFTRTMFYSGAGRRRGGRGGGQAQLILVVVALAFAILAPIIAQILYFACSRRREYLADASGAAFTRYPEGLASALEKISTGAPLMTKVNRAVAPMFTVNPREATSSVSGLFSTHPPTEDRVRVLRSMAGGAAFADYQAAYEKLHGTGVIGAATMAQSRPVGVRPPSPEPEPEDLDKARETVDILHRMGGFLFLQCACGLKIKVPPGQKGDEVQCPRCGRGVPVPQAAAVAAAAAASLEAAGEDGVIPPLKGEPTEAAGYTCQYTPGKWQSLRCPCGWTVNLSPNFSAPEIQCKRCGRTIKVERA
jgi:heat shock protein HtpX